MASRAQTIEIFAPTAGHHYEFPSTILDPRMQPDGNDAKLYYGVNQKEFGTTIYATGSGSVLGAPLSLIDEAIYANGNVLQVFTHTGVFRYSSTSDGYLTDGQTFTGTFTDYWSSVMHNDTFVYSNGIDPVQYKASFSVTGTNVMSALSPTTYKSWALASFRNHLCLYHTIENGSEQFKRVRWSKVGLLTYTAGATDFASGVAGFADLQDVEGEIKTVASLGIGNAIYGDRSIHVQTWVGGSEVFNFTKTVAGVGTPSRRGAVAVRDVNYIIGWDNIYSYHGGDDLRDIGTPVKKKLYSTINYANISDSFIEYDPTEEEILVHIPTGTSTMVDTVWVYRIKDETWSKLTRSYTAYGRTSRSSGLTIGELIGPISAQNFTFGDAFVRAGALTRVYGDQSGRVVKGDATVYSLSIDGTTAPQSFSYVTPDLTAAKSVDPVDKSVVDYTSNQKRWLGFQFEAVGNGTAYVSHSTAAGVTYTNFPESPITLTANYNNYVLDLDISSDRVRYQISNTATNEFVGVRYAETWFIPGSDDV